MKIVNRIRHFFARSPTIVRSEMVQQIGNGFYSWNGNIYKSDIVRSCVRPFYKSVGKLKAIQTRQMTNSDLQVSPDLYIKLLLEEPNPYMTGQVMQEKLALQFALNNNAYAYINRDDNGFAMEIYPINAAGVEAIYDENYQLFFRFTMLNGKNVTFPYEDVIHIRQDFLNNDIFGTSNIESLLPLMEIVTTVDQGIIKAIKNSAVIKWLLKYKIHMRPEDIKKQTQQFVKDFMSVDDSQSDEESAVGAAGTDSKADIVQVTPTDFVPNASQMDKTVNRIYNFFGTNESIIKSDYTEDQWNSYFESVIKPISMQLSGEFTRKIFSRRERGFGNRIIFTANSMEYASMASKLNLLQMVDRGAMTPNEWREILNYGPIEGGDQPIRRLDTAVVSSTGASVGGGTNGNA